MPETSLGALGRERRMRQEAEDAEPDVEAHEDHVATSGEHLAVVGDAAEPRRALSGERVVASPGQPDHHGARALCWSRGRPDVEGEAVLLPDDLPADDLRAHRPGSRPVPHAVPGRRRLGRAPAQGRHRRLGVGDTLEPHGLALAHPAHGADIRADHVLFGGAGRGARGAGWDREESACGEEQACDGAPKRKGLPCVPVRHSILRLRRGGRLWSGARPRFKAEPECGTVPPRVGPARQLPPAQLRASAAAESLNVRGDGDGDAAQLPARLAQGRSDLRSRAPVVQVAVSKGAERHAAMPG